MKNVVLCSVLLALGSAPIVAASAQDLQPLRNYSIHLGDVNGSVYVTDTPAGSHMVATLSSGERSTPVRFVTDLAPDQSATLSVPRGPGQAALEVTFTRHDGRVLVTDASTVVSSN